MAQFENRISNETVLLSLFWRGGGLHTVVVQLCIEDPSSKFNVCCVHL